MKSTLTRMTLIRLVDDPAVNNTYAEFLLQVQAYHRVRDKPV